MDPKIKIQLDLPPQSIYSALPKSRSGRSKTIRILKLRPGLEAAQIECDLLVADLETRPRFEALSYVWGKPNPPDAIICSGQSLHVTPNLALALRRLRSPYMARTIWIDAICVNQNDLDERSQQVRLMRTIYKQAWRVVVWLGEDTGLAMIAIRTIEWFVNDCCATIGMSLDEIDLSYGSESETKIRPGHSSAARIDLPIPVQTADEWRALEWFYERPWFSRIWIIQEVAFAPAVMYLGLYEIGWKAVAVAAAWISWSVKHPPQKGLFDIYARVEDIYEQSIKQGSYLEDFLVGNLVRYSNATDPRDKIFALLGIMHRSDRKSSLLQPDYSKSVQEVYGNVVRQLLRENDEDSAFNMDEAFAAIEMSDSEIDDFPSWIPRWDKPSMLKDPRYRLDTGFPDLGWSASLDKIPEVHRVPDPGTLVLKGLRINIITHIFPLKRKPGDSEWLRRIWKEISTLLEDSQCSGMKEKTFLKAITGVYYRELAETIEAKSSDACKIFLEMALICSGLEYDDDGNAKHEFDLGADLEAYENPELVSATIESSLNDFVILGWKIHEYPYSLFITEDKNLGIGAKVAKPGDLVCVLLGGAVPYLLRTVGAHYKFMESCYMNGFMHGEAVKEAEAGNLAEEWFEIQ